MPFYVYGLDRPGADPGLEDLNEVHWSYMDRFADRLILRGPTLSANGAEHTGSVHVVDLTDRAEAERFAAEEPYCRAGLYLRVTTEPVVILAHRAPANGSPADEAPNALVTGEWRPRPGGGIPPGPDADLDGRISFAAVLVDEGQSRTTGIVSVVTTPPGEAVGIVQPFVDRLAGGPVTLTAQRWTRGGRR
jgi:uncharacterized protein YciI